MNNALRIACPRTALVLIDLQQGIAGMPVEPHSGKDVVANAVTLADAMRSQGGLVVVVRVSSIGDGKDMLQPLADAPSSRPGGYPEGWDVIVPELAPQPGDLLITKHQWGAFYGTELDLQLRRRGIGTIIIGGISTNMGVESTARDAFERGYQQIFVEDMMSAMSAEAHAFAITNIFPRIGRVRKTAEVATAISGGINRDEQDGNGDG